MLKVTQKADWNQYCWHQVQRVRGYSKSGIVPDYYRCSVRATVHDCQPRTTLPGSNLRWCAIPPPVHLESAPKPVIPAPRI